MPVLENAKHERFAQLIVAGKNLSTAYHEAGFEKLKPAALRVNASRLNANKAVAARITDLLALAAKRVEIDKSWVLRKLVKNVRRGLQETPVRKKIDGEWQDTGVYQYEGSVVNRALELLGKEQGMFVERSKHELTGADGGAIAVIPAGVDHSKLSVQELVTLKALTEKARVKP